MSLLKLQNIGKIYVSDGAVAVGIRGVNLSFDIGEFVAITGKSGSGKTTLLNVLSGMDTYEEGEYFVDGEPTSHYEQKDWETFREKYIAFIFQDYNIIDSFTVLQNVELALMGISSRRERRRRALELIERVGLTQFIHQKGSRLSGGQKQRTVIARALAKDSPIILADEPTGNLDAQTSKEIIALLREISAEKLVIVVTHNFDQVENGATREIRIFDGAVESDRTLRSAAPQSAQKKAKAPVTVAGSVKKGVELGFIRFVSMPKLSIFLCILMILASIGTFAITAQTSTYVKEGFEPAYLFTPSAGRVILTRADGSVLTTEELTELAHKTGANKIVRNDALYDTSFNLQLDYNYETGIFFYEDARFVLQENAEPDVGRKPEAEDEFLLRLPISYQSLFGKDELLQPTVYLGQSYNLKISGVIYYYDNTVEPTIVGGQAQYDYLSVVNAFYCKQTYIGITGVQIPYTVDGQTDTIVLGQSANDSVFVIDSSLKGDEFYFRFASNIGAGALPTGNVTMSDMTVVASDAAGNSSVSVNASVTGGTYRSDLNAKGIKEKTCLVVSSSLAKKITAAVCEKTYSQASLIYTDDKAAGAGASALHDLGYIAVPSNATYNNADEMLGAYMEMILYMFLWFIVIMFLAFVVTVCTTRSMAATKKDIAILRSMGIHNRVIKISIGFQTALTMIPSYIFLTAFAIVMYTLPGTNGIFPFLHAWQYLLIVLGVLFLNVMVTMSYNKKIFKQSVRKTLKGGENA